jgi:hypothetical protein
MRGSLGLKIIHSLNRSRALKIGRRRNPSLSREWRIGQCSSLNRSLGSRTVRRRSRNSTWKPRVLRTARRHNLTHRDPRRRLILLRRHMAVVDIRVTATTAIANHFNRETESARSFRALFLSARH